MLALVVNTVLLFIIVALVISWSALFRVVVACRCVGWLISADTSSSNITLVNRHADAVLRTWSRMTLIVVMGAVDRS